MSASYLLGIDAGTTVIKSTLFDLAGRELAGAAHDSSVIYPRPGWAEADMDAVWQAVVASVRDTLAQTPVAPEQIAAVGLTGQGDGTWLVDANHHPVRPAILWTDGRAGPFVQACHRSGLSSAIFRITNTALTTCNQAVQMRWLQEHEPDVLPRTAAALRAKDWIFLRLTGIVSTDESDASLTFFAAGSRAYDDRILTLLGVEGWRHTLPPVRRPVENVGTLLPAVALELGLPANTPVVSGPFDVVATALGVGALRPGDACTIMGTAGIHLFVSDAPMPDPENVGHTVCHALPDRLVRLVAPMSSTANLQWFVGQFFADEVATAKREGANIWERLEAIAAEVPLGARGVMYHPYLDPAGERAPFVAPNARAQFTGICAQHARADLLAAVYEGVVLGALDCYALMPIAVGELKLAGGGARSARWAQMFADALGCRVTVAEGSEFGAKGAALNAGLAMGLFSSYEAAVAATVRPARRYEPDLSKRDKYAVLLQIYRTVRDAMLPVWEERARLLAGLRE